MMIRPHSITAVEVMERSQVAMARYRALSLARLQDFNEPTLGRLALVVTEAANNLIYHAHGGEVILSASSDGRHRWIDLLFIDRGPGIVNLKRALEGGASTANSLGEGLGAIRRLSDRFDIFSSPGAGTVIASRLYGGPGAFEINGQLELGAVLRTKPGQTDCGDGWGFRALPGGSSLLLMVDGLGHGSAAHQATERALKVMADAKPQGVEDLLLELHSGLAGTRGAAAACIRLDAHKGSLEFAGLGNIEGSLIVDGKRRGLASLNGTLGHGSVAVQAFHYPWPEDSVVLMHTDGIANRWSFDDYPGLARRHPALIAGTVYRDHGLSRDDAGILVLRRRRRR